MTQNALFVTQNTLIVNQTTQNVQSQKMGEHQAKCRALIAKVYLCVQKLGFEHGGGAAQAGEAETERAAC